MKGRIHVIVLMFVVFGMLSCGGQGGEKSGPDVQVSKDTTGSPDGSVTDTSPVTHTVVVHSGPHGSTDKDGTNTVRHGDTITITATPESTYKFINWSGDVTGTGNPLTLVVTGDMKITANFGIRAYKITVVAGAHGTISPYGAVAVTEGGPQTFTITPNAGYHVADVLVDGISVGATTTYTFKNVTANHTISATFAINEYTVTVSSGPHGKTDKDGTNQVEYGDIFTVTAIPDKTYNFVNWTGSVTSTDNPLTMVVAKDIEIKANFAKTIRTITASAGPHGSILPHGAVAVPGGNAQIFKITPDKGYHVADVLVDGVSVGPRTSYTFTNVVANHTISATFAIDTYTVTVQSGTHGSTDKDGTNTVNHGDTFTITATPATAYRFAGWSGDVTSTDNPITIVVVSDMTIVANFERNYHTITATAGEHGIITPKGAVSVLDGESQSFTITPDEGYHVADVQVDGAGKGPVATYTFTNVMTDHTISASFARLVVAAPTNLTATDGVSDANVIVVWDPVPNVEKYYVYRSQAKDGPYTKVAEVTSTSYTDTSAEVGVLYYYRVKAYQNGFFSDFSNTDSGYRNGKLGRASNVTATDGTYADKVVVAWSAVAPATGYYVMRSTDPTGAYTRITTTSDLTYTDLSAQPTTMYYYKVQAYSDLIGTGLQSGYDQGWRKMMTPKNLSATQGAWDVLTVTWDAVTGAQGYKLYRSLSETGGYTVVYTGTDTHWEMRPKDATAYYFKVQAINYRFGDSDLSAPVSGYIRKEVYEQHKTILCQGISAADQHKLTYDRHGFLYMVVNNQILKAGNWDRGLINTIGDDSDEPTFTALKDVAITPDNYYILALDSNKIVRMTIDGKYQDEYNGGADFTLNDPSGLVIDNASNIYILDTGNDRVVKVRINDQDKFEFVKAWGSHGNGDGEFNGPKGIAISRSLGRLFIADTLNDRVQEFDLNGNFVSQFGGTGTGDTQFQHPVGIAADNQGEVFVVDNNRLRKFDSAHAFITSMDLTPTGIATDPSGWHLYLGDLSCIRLFKKRVYEDHYGLGKPAGFNASDGTLEGKVSMNWQGVEGAAYYVVLASKYHGSGYPLTRVWTTQAQIDSDCNATLWVQAYDQDLGYGPPSGQDQGWPSGAQAKACHYGEVTWQWGTSGYDAGKSVAVDSSGNIYVTGLTKGSLGGTNAGGNDAFLTKFSPYGTRVWTRQWGTSSNDGGNGVAVDSRGNIYVTGSTQGSLGGPNAGNSDVFLTKFSPSGTRVWTRQWGTSSSDGGNSVAVDSTGDIYVTGDTFGSLGGPNAGSGDVFLTKFSPSGTSLWTKQWGTSSDDRGYGVAVDSSGNIYVTGLTNAGDLDVFLTKFSPSGTRAWTRQWGTSSNDSGQSVAVDSSDNIYVTGFTQGSLGGTNAGGWDVFLTKFSPSGTRVWTRQWGSSSSDGGNSVAVDSRGNIYVTGYTYGSLGRPNAGSIDVFLTKFSPSGTQAWTRQWGTSSNDYGQSVAVDPTGYIYVTGYTKGSLGGTNAGGNDVFLIRTSPLK